MVPTPGGIACTILCIYRADTFPVDLRFDTHPSPWPFSGISDTRQCKVSRLYGTTMGLFDHLTKSGTSSPDAKRTESAESASGNATPAAASQRSVQVSASENGLPSMDSPSESNRGSGSAYSGSPHNASSDGVPGSLGSDSIRDVKCEILANWLHTKQEEKCWCQGMPGEGVFVKKSKGNYACVPATLANDETNLYAQIVEMNVRVSEKISPIALQNKINQFIVCHDSQNQSH